MRRSGFLVFPRLALFLSLGVFLSIPTLSTAQSPTEMPPPAVSPGDDDEDDEVKEKEYWKDVDFGPDDFEIGRASCRERV